MAQQHIHVIITGGTIDSAWDPSKDTATTAEKSIIPEYLEKLKLDIELSYNEIMMKDSRALTPDDIRKICQAVDDSPADMILITHGTYTMPDTARYLISYMKPSKKAVVLTGSVVPLRGYDQSDAGFNLGFAMATLTTMDPGVKIALQGHLFDPVDVGKNLQEGRFFSLDELHDK